jgi:hypothetical protein
VLFGIGSLLDARVRPAFDGGGGDARCRRDDARGATRDTERARVVFRPVPRSRSVLRSRSRARSPAPT